MNMKQKSPFNWAGNKYKYLDKIKLQNNYKRAIELFGGSGNIAFNFKAEKIMYNEIIPLLPYIYKFLQNNKLDLSLMKEIIYYNNKFQTKDDYYKFRKNWNITWKKILEEQHVCSEFVIETLLLTKMCSNSMIRFNKKLEFNQGFRGTTKEFFSSKRILKLNNELSEFNNFLYQNKKFSFISRDFRTLLKISKDTDFIIADPPYLISQGFYGEEYTEQSEKDLIKFLFKRSFVYFNYLYHVKEKERIENIIAQKLIDNIDCTVIPLRNIATTGQNRKGKTDVEEVLIIREL